MNHDEVADIPDRVFMDSYTQNAKKYMYEEDSFAYVAGRQAGEWASKMAVKVTEVCNSLEAMHGHGPAEVVWESDFHRYAIKVMVNMPYKEGCALCEVGTEPKNLREK